MEEERRRDWQYWALSGIALASLAAFCYLRLRNLGHLLLWDEAQFVLYTRSFVDGTNDQWARFIHLHPPIYLWINSLLYRVFGTEAAGFEVVSILFSLGTLLLTWRLAHVLFGRWAGVLAMFFLAVLPASTVIDTWIKQDAAAVFFLTLTIYLFVREKYAWGGVALGLGMLCKETAVFALLALGTYSVLSWRRSQVWGVAKVALIGAAISAWWYIFVSDYVGNFADFFLGRGNESRLFSQPWHYYFSGLPDDLGWIILAAAGAGAAYCLWRRFQGSRVHLLPLAWFLSIYAFLSISAGKPYWMVTTALPALAILASIGVVETAQWLGKHIHRVRLARALQGLLIGAMMLAAFAGAARTSDVDYNVARFPAYWQQADLSRQDAEFLKENMGEADKLFIIFNAIDRWDPTLVYYLGDIDFIPGTSGMLGSPEDLAAYVRATGADWIYLANDDVYYDQLQGFLAAADGLMPVESVYSGDWSIIIKLGGN
jgi:4-amino-4-deoxy-L-arabinose transferase-like glycosyltransferase